MHRACPPNRHAWVSASCRKRAKIGTKSARLRRTSARCGAVPSLTPSHPGARVKKTRGARDRESLDDQVDQLPRDDDRLADLLAIQVGLNPRRGLRALDQLL